MKNVKCMKLTIDRQKAPSKVGTCGNITLYGSLKFPTSGSYCGGISAYPIAGIGVPMQKKKAQMAKLSGSANGVAGKTGAHVAESGHFTFQEWGVVENTQDEANQTNTYSVEFVKIDTRSAVTL